MLTNCAIRCYRINYFLSAFFRQIIDVEQFQRIKHIFHVEPSFIALSRGISRSRNPTKVEIHLSVARQLKNLFPTKFHRNHFIQRNFIEITSSNKISLDLKIKRSLTFDYNFFQRNFVLLRNKIYFSIKGKRELVQLILYYYHYFTDATRR